MLLLHDAKEQLLHQLDSFYGKTSLTELNAIDEEYRNVLTSLSKCFLHIRNKYYHNDVGTIFNPLHAAQWTMFLYQMARSLINASDNNRDLCDKIYGVAKCFSSADIYYEVKMPSIWFFDHPQGSVMGRAEYSDFFSFSQGCTVGNNKGLYPRFGKHVTMFSDSKVLGNCQIGDHVIFSANSFLIDQDVPAYSIVFGTSPNNVIHPISPEKFIELTASIFAESE